jgi:Asp-tRNA(Asn)/Glu-tRNA(Gln) amidotransferase A subunit family amidase
MGQIASTDTPMVARLREAGAIPLARTNLPDFAFRWDSVSGVGGHTRNPWDPTRTPGGTSGGEAVAPATGMRSLGFGNNLGGSLRSPSQMCGTTPLRRSRSRVADLRLALSIINAPDPRDPRRVPAPLEGPAVEGRIRLAVVHRIEPDSSESNGFCERFHRTMKEELFAVTFHTTINESVAQLADRSRPVPRVLQPGATALGLPDQDAYTVQSVHGRGDSDAQRGGATGGSITEDTPGDPGCPPISDSAQLQRRMP